MSLILFIIYSCKGIQSDNTIINKKNKDIYCWMLSQNKEPCFNNENIDFFLRLTIVGGLGLPTYVFTLKKQDKSITLKEKKQIKIDSFITESVVYNENIFFYKNEECNKYLNQENFFKKEFTPANKNNIIIDDGLQWFLEVKNRKKYNFISRSFTSETDKNIVLKIVNIYDIKYEKLDIEKLFSQ